MKCPRCEEEVENLVGRKDGKKTEGKYDKICEECAVAVQQDEFDEKYID